MSILYAITTCSHNTQNDPEVPASTFTGPSYTVKPLRGQPDNLHDGCPDSPGSLTVVITPKASTAGYVTPVWDVGIVSVVVPSGIWWGLGTLVTKRMSRVITKQEGICLNTKGILTVFEQLVYSD